MISSFKSLNFISISLDRVVKHKDYINFLEDTIQQFKINPDQRSRHRPLTLVSYIRLNIDKVIRLIQKLHNEKLVKEKLFLDFASINKDPI